MPRVEPDPSFDSLGERETVLQIFPDVFKDSRGTFSEVLKFERAPTESSVNWILKPGWMMQINRSKSISGVFRGLHTQKGSSCQAKLVESVNRRIFDLIVDARPDSSTFGTSKVYVLDPSEQNMVFVPRGFLHGFVVPFEYSNELATFSYYCDNVYDRDSEVTVDPKSFLSGIDDSGWSVLGHEFESTVKEHELVFSEKDVSGMDYLEFMRSVRAEYVKTGTPWYR